MSGPEVYAEEIAKLVEEATGSMEVAKRLAEECDERHGVRYLVGRRSAGTVTLPNYNALVDSIAERDPHFHVTIKYLLDLLGVAGRARSRGGGSHGAARQRAGHRPGAPARRADRGSASDQ